MANVSAERLAEVFVEVSDTLVDEFDLIEFLHMVTTRATELVGAAAAGLLLADGHGRLQFMAASHEQAQLLELFQVQHAEGPCLDAFNTGRPVVNEDLERAAGRWPHFCSQATGFGLRSVHAIPMRLRNEVIGALNLFGRDTGEMDPADIQILQALADVASIGLLHERAIRRAESLSEQLQGALNSRIVIEQAKGVVAQQHNIGVDEAFELLRGYARRNHRRLTEVAHTAVNDPSSLSDLVG